MTPMITLEDSVTEIRLDLAGAMEALNPWRDPDEGARIQLGLLAGHRAFAGLSAVIAAIADLEPGPALTVLEAIET